MGFPSGISAVGMCRVLSSCEPLRIEQVNQFKERVKALVVQRVRLKMFAEGKAFVAGKDGKNPLATAAEPAIKALNAPACQGLIAEMTALGIDMTDGGVLPAFVPLTVDQIAKKTDGCMKQVVATGDGSGQLLLLLGVDEYNKFVKVFNEGK